MSNSFLDFFDRPIAFHRVLVRVTGGVKSALMLGQLIYWSKRTKDVDGWVYKTQKEWEEETGLTRREQETARKMLVERKVIEEKLAKSPAKLHYRIHPQFAQNVQTRLHETAKPVCTKAPNSLYTEITTENTTLADKPQTDKKEQKKEKKWTQSELSEKINKMLNDSLHLQVIATFFGFKGYGIHDTPITIANQKELSFLISRYARSASRLAKAYDLEKIEGTMQILDEYAPFDWTMESVENYIGRSSTEIIKALKAIKKK